MTEHSFISFGGLLRQLRAEAGLTQEALADAAGLSARTVSDLERGVNSTARKESARLLADALGLTGQAREDFEVVARGRGPSQEPIVRTRLPPTAPQRTAAGGVLLPDGPMQVVVGEIPREPPGFVSRGLLGQIKDAAEQRQVAVVCAVTGLRGVGKTQVAAAYARARIADGCSLVGWVNAGTTGGMLAGLARVADRLGVADPDGDSVESAARLREYLNARPEPGLLVFDNAVDMDGLRHNLPAAGGTQLVITSTDRRFAELGAALDVSVFARPESLGYLADRTGLADEAGANAVAAALGDLPLGLAQAAAAIRGQHLTYQGYLQRLRRVPVADLLGRVPGGDYPHATAASLLLSIQDVEAGEDAGLVSRILRVAAALSANGVRRELLSDLAAEEPDDSSVMVDAAIERCVAGSLLCRGFHPRLWSMNSIGMACAGDARSSGVMNGMR